MVVDTDTRQRELVITRIIDAPRALVFKAWMAPEHVVRWWGPQGFTVFHCEMDVRVGGAYRCAMRSPQGTEYWKRGVYREIVEPERVAFTFAWERPDGSLEHELLTTVTFEEHGAKTRLTLRQGVFANSERRDEHVAGWSSTLERLAEYLTAQGE
ncbi:MAG TPA: SRPBCC domain-containing protein [Acetobacteraceae bacterium]|nr:SRPBCC domain-containing protein [Acetobacteraceae bacterium]